MQLTLGRIKLSLRGTLLKDRSETLLVRPEVGSDVEIPKTNVLAVEEARRCCKVCHTFAPEQIPVKDASFEAFISLQEWECKERYSMEGPIQVLAVTGSVRVRF